MALEKLANLGSALSNALSPFGAITGIASSIGGVISSIGQGKRQRQLLAYQDQLADENYRQQLADQWKMYERQMADQRALIDDQNRYNSYSSVRKRAEEAHINPLAAITGQTGGIGIQSTGGSTPSASPGSGYSGTGSINDQISANLITAGSSLMANSREYAMMNEQLKSLQLENERREIDLKWQDKKLAQDYEKNEGFIALQEAQTAERKVNARYITSLADLNDQLKDVNETLNPIKISQAETSLQLAREQLFQMEFKTDTQRQAFQMSIAESKAQIESLLGNLYMRGQELEQRAKEFGLSEQQFDEVKRVNRELEKYRNRVQDFDEKMRRKEFTRDTIIKSVDTYFGALESVGDMVGGVFGALLKL